MTAPARLARDPQGAPAHRQRLPNRRECFTDTITVGGARYDAAVGFDEHGDPREIFLTGVKTGSDMAAILADTSVVVSIALQHGVKAAALCASVSRVPLLPDDDATEPASVIGAALDLLAAFEGEDWRARRGVVKAAAE